MKTPTTEERNTLLQQAKREHAQLKAAILSLSSRRFLSPDEKVEVSNLKKRKLRIKDRLTVLQMNP